MAMRVCLWRYPVAKIRSGMPASLAPGRSNFCTCPRHLSMQVSLRPVPVAGYRSGSDVFPCRTAVRGRWTGIAVRGFTSEGARRAAVGRVAPTGRTCPQAPGGIWPDGNTGGNDNYPVCLRHSGQQSHTYYCLLSSVSWFCR